MNSRELLAELTGLGLSKAEIARALGRNSSILTPIERGIKPGTWAQDALQGLLDGVRGDGDLTAALTSVAPPERRKKASGETAAVRRATLRGRGWSTTSAKRQAVRGGARQASRELGTAAALGRVVAFDVVLPASVNVTQSGNARKRGALQARGGSQQLVTIGEGGNMSAESWAAHVAAVGLPQAIAEYLVSSGRAETVTTGDILAVEMRTWDSR